MAAKATESSYKVWELIGHSFYPVEKPPVGELLRFVGMGQRQTCSSLGFDLTLPRLAWEGEAQVWLYCLSIVRGLGWGKAERTLCSGPRFG